VGVVRLTLTDFRSYQQYRMETDLRPVVLTGPNGVGKTNLLEAISFLAPGRGLRRAKLSEVGRADAADAPQGAWAVAAQVQTQNGPLDIGTGRAAGPSDRRLIRINGDAARSQSDLGAYISTVWLTPAMDRLFTDAPSGRRRFLDRLVYGLDPDHAGRLSAFENAHRQRQRLLKDGVTDGMWYDALETTMAEHGVAVAAARRDLLSRLSEALEASDGPFPKADVALHGVLEGWLEHRSALSAEDDYRALLCASRARERAGAPTEGPQRSDLMVFHRRKNQPAARCSTGEQKALLIALLLAQARVQGALRGAAPLLLLDEVAAHLDDTRRRALYDELVTLGAQAWLTGTDRALFDGFADRAQFFALSEGHLH
jgi:DNA replication and repair protein RecF